MARWLFLGTCLALAGCAATPAATPPAAPSSAERVPGVASGRSSDAAPFIPVPRGFPWPSPRRGWSPTDERPPWLPSLPENLERYPVPDHWRGDTLAALRVTPAD